VECGPYPLSEEGAPYPKKVLHLTARSSQEEVSTLIEAVPHRFNAPRSWHDMPPVSDAPNCPAWRSPTSMVRQAVAGSSRGFGGRSPLDVPIA